MALIVHLPTAASSPIVNRQRRGRFPRGVTPIREGRLIRWRREDKLSLEIERLRVASLNAFDAYVSAQVDAHSRRGFIDRAEQ